MIQGLDRFVILEFIVLIMLGENFKLRSFSLSSLRVSLSYMQMFPQQPVLKEPQWVLSLRTRDLNHALRGTGRKVI
jgi:hypothetical protein